MDVLLVVSFGGPEGPDDVVPFLENVTRGRGIPRERLVEVGAHYAHFGGVSPINEINRTLVDQIRDELAARGEQVPVIWGNRNWDPYLADALREARGLGATRIFALLTSAYSSYSGCRQYRENLFDALAEVTAEDPRWSPQVLKLRTYFNHPGFIESMVDATRTSLDGLPEGSRLVFTTHSIPVADADRCDYVAQHRDVAATIAVALGRGQEWDLVYQSRSGAPHIPWLEPDIGDHLAALADAGAPGAVMVPIGFISDHMEVIWDLDTIATEQAREAGHPGRTGGHCRHGSEVHRDGRRPPGGVPGRGGRGGARAEPDDGCAGSAGGAVRRGLLPEPTWTAPGAVRVRLVTGGPAAFAVTDLGLEHELLAVAWRSARAAGDLLMAGREQVLTVTTKSTLTDVVTQMDTEAEALVVGTILAARPDDGLLGEEGADRAGSTGVRWIVDPLDGTVNYLYGLPSWAVSIAAEVDGVVEVGIVDVPLFAETFVAVRGQGAVRVAGTRVERIAPGAPESLSQALVATGFGYAEARRAAQARTLATVLPAVRDIRRAGAAAVDLCWAAAGRVDCYYERGLNPWDFAAGVLVATESGLVAGGPGDGPPSSELTWLAPAHLAAGVPGAPGPGRRRPRLSRPVRRPCRRRSADPAQLRVVPVSVPHVGLDRRGDHALGDRIGLDARRHPHGHRAAGDLGPRRDQRLGGDHAARSAPRPGAARPIRTRRGCRPRSCSPPDGPCDQSHTGRR